MKKCFRCGNEMIIVELVDTWGKVYKGIVCPECGRFHSKHRRFWGYKNINRSEVAG